MENIVEFTIARITTEQFAILEDSFVAEKDIKLAGEFKFAVRQEGKEISAYCRFMFEQDDNAFMIISVGCHFSIKENSWGQLVQDGKIVVERDFMIHLLTITVGTARGILHTKTENTRFNQYHLPALNLASAVADDLVTPVS